MLKKYEYFLSIFEQKILMVGQKKNNWQKLNEVKTRRPPSHRQIFLVPKIALNTLNNGVKGPSSFLDNLIF